MTPSPGPIQPHHAGSPSCIIQGFFPVGRPRIVQASPAPVAPVRPQVPAPVQARPGSPPAPVVPGRPVIGALQPSLRPGQPPRPILPTKAQPGAVQPATPLRPQAPQPILPQRATPTAVQPHAGSAFPLPGNFTLKPRGSGQPLPETVQKKMEAFFNTNFADVRVHVGHEAPSIGALAFTHGTDLYFAPGQYNPQTTHGQQLLGHELTHVVQQRAGRVRNPLGTGVAVVQDPALEAEAVRMGLRVPMAPLQAKRAEATPLGPSLNSPGPPSARSSPGPLGGTRPRQPDVSTMQPILPRGSAGNPRAIIANGPGSIQRLVAVKGNNVDRLYVPAAWMETKLDASPKGETIQQVLEKGAQDVNNKNQFLQLLANLTELMGFEVTKDNIIPVQDAQDIIDFLQERQKLPRSTVKLKNVLQDALLETNAVTDVEVYSPINASTPKRKLTVLPNDLVRGKVDIRAFDMKRVCALISIYKAVSLGDIKKKLDLPNDLNNDRAYYEALHNYYWTKKKIDYAEPVNHPKIFKEWGFEMIHSGDTSWKELPESLKPTLMKDKKYIVGLERHSTAVRMKQELSPEKGYNGQDVTSVFEFLSDPANFSETMTAQRILYIYGRK